MRKRGYRPKYLWIGLIVFIGFIGLFNYISSADQKIEIKKETLKDNVQCWSWPKTSENIPNFFMGLKQITGAIIDFTGINELPFGHSVAFLVGVSKYKYLSPQLPFVENDLEELANSLLINNGFDKVYLVKNEAVTPTLIRDYLLNKFRKELNSNDRLLFYYSGHGADIGGDTGFMQFSSFKTLNDYDINNDVLGITDCEQWSRLIKIKHMLFIFDCCVSGLGFTPKGPEADRAPTCLSLSGNGSRTVITAGTGKENVYGSNDYSIFTKALLTTLNDDKLYQQNNGFLTIGEIFDQIKRKISQSKVKQTPNMWDLEEDKYRGNFVFIDTKLQNVKLSADDIQTLHIAKTGIVVGEYGIIRLTAYVSGKVYIDGKEVGDIKSGEAREYIDQPVGEHTIKIVSEETIAIGTASVAKGEIASLSITTPIVKPKEVIVNYQYSNPSEVNSVAFSPDGKNALSGGRDNPLKLWDVHVGKEVRRFTGHSSDVTAIVCSPSGKYALSGSQDASLKLWEVNTGKEIRSFTGHFWRVRAVALSPDGRYALSGGSSENGTLKLFETSTGKEIRSFTGHSNDVTSVVFSPDGKYALTGSHDYTLKLWAINTGSEIRSFTGHSDSVTSVAFSPDGKYALSGSHDYTLKLWAINTGSEIESFTGHSGFVTSVAFSPDGKYALSGSADTTLKLWEINTGKEIRSFIGYFKEVNSVAFSPNGKYALSGSRDTTTRIWSIATGREIAQFVGFDDGEWVVLTTEGYYNASAKGAQYLNVKIGKDVYPMDDYVKTYYRPDLVQKALQGEHI
ncbi:MAG TPA: caspase family protein [Bacillota bacterium]|nr:caspase family protein [Bacillota bacterium]